MQVVLVPVHPMIYHPFRVGFAMLVLNVKIVIARLQVKTSKFGLLMGVVKIIFKPPIWKIAEPGCVILLFATNVVSTS